MLSLRLIVNSTPVQTVSSLKSFRCNVLGRCGGRISTFAFGFVKKLAKQSSLASMSFRGPTWLFEMSSRIYNRRVGFLIAQNS